MPFAVLLGWCHEELRPAPASPALPETRAALVGARDLDPGEAGVERSGLASSPASPTALAALPDGGAAEVHLDGDVLDPAARPASTSRRPAAGRRSACWTSAAARGTGRIVGVSVCCGNPSGDPDGRGAQAYAAAVRALLP